MTRIKTNGSPRYQKVADTVSFCTRATMQAALLLVLTVLVGVLIPVHRFVEVRCRLTRTACLHHSTNAVGGL